MARVSTASTRGQDNAGIGICNCDFRVASFNLLSVSLCVCLCVYVYVCNKYTRVLKIKSIDKQHNKLVFTIYIKFSVIILFKE